MIRASAPSVGICLAAGCRAPAASAAAPIAACPRELLEDDPKLPLTAERLRDQQPLTIVAIGGAATAGIAAADPRGDGLSAPAAGGAAPPPSRPADHRVNKGVARQTTAGHGRSLRAGRRSALRRRS